MKRYLATVGYQFHEGGHKIETFEVIAKNLATAKARANSIAKQKGKKNSTQFTIMIEVKEKEE